MRPVDSPPVLTTFLASAASVLACRVLTVHGPAAPTLRGLETGTSLRLLDRFLHTPTVVVSLHNLGVRHGRVGAEEEIVRFLACRVPNQHEANRFVAADVMP